MAKNDTKFEWDATESAPEHYPMEIIRGTFIYHGEAEAGLYIPSGGTLSSGWGEPISSHLVGEKYKPLPDRLEIIFFSYAEKQFYKGEFDLPYEKILALFRDGIANPRVFPNGETRPGYISVIAGIAPGGVVAVWVTGYQRKIEVFFGQARKVELNPGAAFALPFDSKEESDAYIAKQLVNSLTPEELESLKRDGIPFDLWARYRNRYDWQPRFTEGHSPDNIDLSYLNGEHLNDWVWTDRATLGDLRPVPRQTRFMTSFDGQKVLFTVTFDEFETMDAFEKLGASGKKVYIEFEPRMPRTDIRIRLRNEKETIELKKFVSKK